MIIVDLSAKNLEQIVRTELRYISCFSSVEQLGKGIRFFDEEIPDMYSHNLTYMYEGHTSIMREFVEDELEYSKSSAKKFLNIQCSYNKRSEVTFKGLSYEWNCLLSYYVFDNNYLEKLKIREDCIIKEMTEQMLDEGRMFDIETNGEELGVDFAERRFDRRSKVYLSDTDVKHYLCYIGNEVVGQVDLFVNEWVAKIEDFDVCSKWQRQGVGTTMLKILIDIALKKGSRIIYLITDAEETAKEMYMKSGMHHVGDKYEVFFEI